MADSLVLTSPFQVNSLQTGRRRGGQFGSLREEERRSLYEGEVSNSLSDTETKLEGLDELLKRERRESGSAKSSASSRNEIDEGR